jgi:cyclase
VKQYTGDPSATRDSGRLTADWAREAVDRGAGEIVLNAMARDGVRDGYDLAHARDIMEVVTVPLIVSGGAGKPQHFRDAFVAGASGALAATVFHDRLIDIGELKSWLGGEGVEVRL